MRRAAHLMLMTTALLLCVASVLLTFVGGFLLLPTAVTLFLLTVRLPDHLTGSGLVLLSILPLPLFLAWVNWGGPGWVCHEVLGPSCADAGSPWPFVTVTAILALGGSWLTYRGVTSATARTCWLRPAAV